MATRTQVLNRLKRARGQLDGLIEHIESGDANCRDVLTQFAAVNSAMKRASYLAVATIMSQCTIVDSDHGNDDALAPEAVESLVKTGSVTLEELEQLFLRLA
ncbi:metal-sensitive transcriptional regulator [Actinomyces bouchesdurhonensis]|uniref:metal-sensitive transcriptional regulator n=1 Tax=Actinomyces bouchesdurhonensis TaxID=1852361 RepID=UPI0028EE2EFA|nr:metal-sensitive transcriptional regulator [Actinomyces bouchesdurhonensis]